MKKRDLKADLEELKSYEEDDVHFMSTVCFIENNAKRWLEQGVVELERAVEAERLNDMLVKYNEFLVAKVLNEQERSEQLESLVREFAETLEQYEKWEENLLLEDGAWDQNAGLPVFTQKLYDNWIEIQTMRNQVLVKAKEVLGDDQG